MKTVRFSLLVLLFVASSMVAQKQILITNNADFARKAEMVEVKVTDLHLAVPTSTIVLKDANGKEVAYQWVYNGHKTPQLLIFQADVAAKSTVRYYLKTGKPAAVKSKTYARFVPERKDDFAWENDVAAYRMYGPALANENPSNGVDLWLKSTNELVVDKRYVGEAKNGISYHIDHGDGLDCYKVAHTLGAGGIAPYANEKLWVGNHYSSYKIVESGPLRTTFTLTYDTVLVGQNVLKQTITITTNAGAIMNKAEVKYEGKAAQLKLAGGIFLHDGKGLVTQNAAHGFISYAEDAVSDAGVPAGRNYVGVIMPTADVQSLQTPTHLLLLADYKVGTSYVYYFGAGWNKWGFPADKDWTDAVDRFSASVKQPLKIVIK